MKDHILYSQEDLGWDDFFEAGLSDLNQHFSDQPDNSLPAFQTGRVAFLSRGLYRLLTPAGDFQAELSGAYLHRATSPQDFPTVGDWVVFRRSSDTSRALIDAFLPRRSLFLRKVNQELTKEQTLAANVDITFLVAGLDDNYNPSRLERYLSQAWQSGTQPVILLTKADLCRNSGALLQETNLIARGAPVHLLSTVWELGIDELRAYFKDKNITAAFLGSSGAGKSTLINCLLGEERQETSGVREGDSRGRHTTTARYLYPLPGGGLVLDTPGMRELQLWDAEEGLDQAFDDIQELAQDCFFKDCRHESEPDCRVQEALESGELEQRRYKNYQKMQKELAFLESRQDEQAALKKKHADKKLIKSYKKIIQAKKTRRELG